MIRRLWRRRIDSLVIGVGGAFGWRTCCIDRGCSLSRTHYSSIDLLHNKLMPWPLPCTIAVVRKEEGGRVTGVIVFVCVVVCVSS